MRSHNRTVLFPLLCIALPIILGCLFYWFFCPDVIGVRLACKLLRIQEHSCAILYPRSKIWLILRYYCPDYLWALSLSSAVLYIGKRYEISLLKCVILCAGFVTVAESIQAFDFLPFVFDMRDIVVQLLGVCTAVFFFLCCFTNKKNGRGNKP